MKDDLRKAIRLRKDAEFAEANVLLGEIKQQLEATGVKKLPRLVEDEPMSWSHAPL